MCVTNFRKRQLEYLNPNPNKPALGDSKVAFSMLAKEILVDARVADPDGYLIRILN